jgi:hypothetical protein
MLSRLGAGEQLRDAEAQLVPLKREAPRDADQLAFEDWVRSQRRSRVDAE